MIVKANSSFDANLDVYGDQTKIGILRTCQCINR